MTAVHKEALMHKEIQPTDWKGEEVRDATRTWLLDQINEKEKELKALRKSLKEVDHPLAVEKSAKEVDHPLVVKKSAKEVDHPLAVKKSVKKVDHPLPVKKKRNGDASDIDEKHIISKARRIEDPKETFAEWAGLSVEKWSKLPTGCGGYRSYDESSKPIPMGLTQVRHLIEDAEYKALVHEASTYYKTNVYDHAKHARLPLLQHTGTRCMMVQMCEGFKAEHIVELQIIERLMKHAWASASTT